jgi:hypothetical protein
MNQILLLNSDLYQSDSSAKSDISNKRKFEESDSSSEKSRNQKEKRSKNAKKQAKSRKKVKASATKTMVKDKSMIDRVVTLETTLSNIESQLSALAKLDEILNTTRSTDKKITAIEKSVDEIKEKQKQNDIKTAAIDGRVLKLEQQISSLVDESNKQQQNALRNEIVIRGLPVLTKENMPELIASLSSFSAQQLDISSFDFIYPIKDKKGENSIVFARFYDERAKKTLMENCKKKRPIVTENLFPKISASDPRRGKEIFIRNKLTLVVTQSKSSL